MFEIKKVTDIIEIRQFINTNKLCLLCVSSDNCSVCDAVILKLEKLMQRYKNIMSTMAKIDYIPEVSGEYMVFSVPTIILFFDGKEILRQDRFIQFENLEKNIDVWYKELF